jgi:hypothetical protein
MPTPAPYTELAIMIPAAIYVDAIIDRIMIVL